MAENEHVAASGGGSSNLLVLGIGPRAVAIAVEHVVELLRMVAIEPLPEAPEWVPGVINLRGRPVPVVDLRARFGMPRAPYGLDTPIVICAYGERLAALVADSAEKVVTVPKAGDVLPDELVGGAHPVAAIARVDDAVVPVLDVGQVCAGTEVLDPFRSAAR